MEYGFYLPSGGPAAQPDNLASMARHGAKLGFFSMEVFIQLTFYVGVPSVETSMRTTNAVFEARGIQFVAKKTYDTTKTPDELFEMGRVSYAEHIGESTLYSVADPDSVEMEVKRLIDEYHWGAICTRPNLDPVSRAICALSAMTVMGRYDQQIRRRIEGALKVGVTPQQILEIFIHLILYGGYINSRTTMRVARSVFT